MNNRDSFCHGDFGSCPYYRPQSNNCLWALCPLHKEEKAMDEFHFVAIADHNNKSGHLKTREEAVKWAEDQMAAKPALIKVLVYSVVCSVEREIPPIKTKEIRAHRMNSET